MFYIFRPHSGGGRIWGMKKLVIIFLLLSSYTPIVIANDVGVYGAPSCGSLLENHKRDNQEYELNKAWIVGSVSGINIRAVIDGNKQIILTDGNDAVYYVVKYCKDNPLHTIIHALEALTYEP